MSAEPREEDECDWCGHTREQHRSWEGDMGRCNQRSELTWCECTGFVEVAALDTDPPS